MKKNGMMMYVLIAGGAYLAYWYLNNFGPTGAVNSSSGEQIPGQVSYWQSWFGGVTATTPTTGATATTVTTPVTGSTSTVTNPPANNGSGSVSTQVMATTSQIQSIINLLTPSDQRNFLAMAPNLTYDQVQTMLANAQACQSGQKFNPTAGVCYNPLPAPTSSTVTRTPPRGHEGVAGMGQIMPLSPYVSPATNGVRDPASLNAGMGDIVPTPPGVSQAATGLGSLGALSRATKSPWGKLPISQAIN